MNAAAASGCSAAELAAGRRFGDALPLEGARRSRRARCSAARATFIAEARRARKLLGGGMRQAGVLAAAGLLAIEDPPDLRADHARAARLAAALRRPRARTVAEPETNMVVVTIERGRPPQPCSRALQGRGRARGRVRARPDPLRDAPRRGGRGRRARPRPALREGDGTEDMSIFKAYDVRGVYPTELDEALARKIGARLRGRDRGEVARGRPRHARERAVDLRGVHRRRVRRRRERRRDRARLDADGVLRDRVARRRRRRRR